MLAQLRHDPSPRVIAALLDNPRLTEGVLAPVLNSASTPPAILELIADDRRWGVRYALRLALVRNPATPLQDRLAAARRAAPDRTSGRSPPTPVCRSRCGGGRGSCWRGYREKPGGKPGRKA